ncbi:MAG: nucleotidyltransferase family protein [Acidimicrobiia bacterium]|nr:nucleotidyltransferase family protein [Acidimicrobiia bacterium]
MTSTRVAGLLLAAGRSSRFAGGDHKLVALFRGRPLAAWALATLRTVVAEGSLDSAYIVTGAVSLAPALRWVLDNEGGTAPSGIPDRGRPGSKDRLDIGRAWSAVTDDDDSTLAAALGLTLVINRGWAAGQASSLAAGVARAEADGHDAVVVGLADQPFIDHRAWAAVAEADGPIVVATFDGKRRPPVKLGAEVWPLLPQEGDVGARTLLGLRPDLVSEIPCMGNPIDIDTLEDLQQWS